MIDLLLNIKNFIASILLGLFNFIKSLKYQVPKLIKQGKNILRKLSNLEHANFDLVDFHINNGNIDDAILRLKIISYFFASANLAASYRLAWCYFSKANFSKSLQYLAKSRALDRNNLLEHLQSSDVRNISELIVQEYKNLTFVAYQKQFDSSKCNVHQHAIALLSKHLKTLPLNFSILDLGASIGLMGKELQIKLPKKYLLTGVESSEQMFNLLSASNYYDELKRDTIVSFLQHNTNCYDCIICAFSLSFKADHSRELEDIYSHLNKGGYFIFVFKGAEATKCNSNKIEFLYDKKDLEKQLKSCKFVIIEEKEFLSHTENANGAFGVFICRVN
jgi:predicted TPR repeat methyltransferase